MLRRERKKLRKGVSVLAPFFMQSLLLFGTRQFLESRQAYDETAP